MFGIQVFDDNQRDVINFISPVYVLDFFRINSGSSGQKKYSFDLDMFTMNWVSSFGENISEVFLDVRIDNETLTWTSRGYSFDIFVFLRGNK
ncbi:hypothetical protein GYM75_08285 [Gilliamella sp. ESL0441]|uniref:hypothetical protein n=1 Tax=unclassified Gilliamella TaxID=2685620 RepID=UPI00080E05D5|nr:MULTISPECIES: hypothetical protein [Gilliamella]OCF95080.1 hypothetical protein A9G10_12380 [Gilliamella apicola]QYN44836.1 hypothetical protein GYM75_08285 [Gilliamella sp. ESL0441]